MPRPIYEEMIVRWRFMTARKAEGATLTQLAAEFGVSRERARQIVAGPEPMPDGSHRSVGVATTRARQRLERQIARWSEFAEKSEIARERVDELKRQLKEMADDDPIV